MPINPKYTEASRALYTPDQLRKANEYFRYVTKTHPEEHRKVAAILEDKGLLHHPQLIKHYLHNKSPIPIRSIALLDTFRESSVNIGGHLPTRRAEIVKR